MPRITPQLIRKAHDINPLLAQLLPVCRDLRSAQRELQWLKQHAFNGSKRPHTRDSSQKLHQYIARRSHGEPLQYILGSEFFGPLEIRCRRSVLIPRQETATSVTHLVNLLASSRSELPASLSVLDLCTGTGCIPLLFNDEFYSKRRIDSVKTEDTLLHLVGVDISSTAIKLAKGNKRHQLEALRTAALDGSLKQKSLEDLTFLQADMLIDGYQKQRVSLLEALSQLRQSNTLCQSPPTYDILISNPPYISTADYWRTTSPSVRRFEPQNALVPPVSGDLKMNRYDGDLFYHRLLDIAQQVNAKVVLFEVAELNQATRVASMLLQRDIWEGVKIWRDYPEDKREHSEAPNVEIEKEGKLFSVPILGSGNGRSVLAYRGHGREWIGQTE